LNDLNDESFEEAKQIDIDNETLREIRQELDAKIGQH